MSLNQSNHAAGYSPVSLIVVLLTTLCIVGAAVLHRRLVSKLEAAGVRVSGVVRNLPWVEVQYFNLCRSRNINPWPDLMPLIGLVLVGITGVIYLNCVGGLPGHGGSL